MSKRLTQEEFLQRAKEVHGNKYDYSFSVYESFRKKIKIICPIHGQFEQSPLGHIFNKNGCPKCWKSLHKTGELQRLYSVDHNFFDEIRDLQSWVLGFFYADGCLKHHTFQFDQSKECGRELLEKIKEILKYTGPVYSQQTSWSDRHSLVITSQKISRILRSFGVSENKTQHCPFPSCIHKKVFYDFLRGYIDGDGCVGIYNSGTTDYLYISWIGTEEFCQECLSRLPFKVSIRSLRTSNNLFEIVVRGKKAVKLGKLLWTNENLPKYRKEPIWREFLASHTPVYIQYEDAKNKARELLKTMNPNQVAKELGLPFQTVYKWRAKWN